MSEILPHASPELRAAAVALSSSVREIVELERLAGLALTDPKAALAGLGDVAGQFNRIEWAIRWMACHTIQTSWHVEKDIVSRFWANLGALLPGAVRVRPDSIDKKHQPDGFLAWRDREVPVEIKRDVFDAKALRQLQRYMAAYDAELGVAVAPTLTATLPANITFVEVTP